MQRNLKIEKMRYQENKLGYNFILAAFLVNMYYLVVTLNHLEISYHIGIEIGFNLITFMAIFLGMEKVKGHDLRWSINFMILALIDLARIFYMPKMLLAQGGALVATGEDVSIITGQAIVNAGYRSAGALIVMAVLLLIAGLVSYRKAKALRDYYGEELGGNN